MIERRNIIELLGKDQAKYRSCILSSYSMDFSFFETRILPALRILGIKNINLLIDGKQLEKEQEYTSGKEFHPNSIYSFQPVYMPKGVFHPKIMLLTGKKHGLLLIGSGNLTASGLNSNDEIWSAFHLDNIENENAEIFAWAWKYLQGFMNQAFSELIKHKYKWISLQSPWLKKLRKNKNQIELKSLNTRLHFVANTPGKSLYAQLRQYVPAGNVKEITIISPYYDLDGSFLKNLYKDFQPEKMNCVIDTASDLLPYEISSSLKNKISFYDWQNTYLKGQKEYYQLHAKIIHFKYKNDEERMFLGSANATLAAFGDDNKAAVNAEAGLIIHRKAKRTWLKELGIRPTKKIQLPERKPNVANQTENEVRIHLKNRILFAELSNAVLKLYLQNDTTGNTGIVLLDRDDLVLQTITPSKSGVKQMEVTIRKPMKVFKVYLADENNKRISNFSFIHRAENILKANPDPQKEKLDLLLASQFHEPGELTELLKYVEYSWVDAEETTGESTKKHHQPVLRITKDKQEKPEYKKLTEEEFNRISDEMLYKQMGIISNPASRIVDFIRVFISNNPESERDYEESIEQKLVEQDDNTGEGESVDKQDNPQKIKRQQNVFKKFFKKWHDTFSAELEEFYREKRIYYDFSKKISLNITSNMLIATYLTQLFQEKKMIVEEDEEAIYYDFFINEHSAKSDYYSIKGFLLNILGKFLLLSTAGFKKYEHGFIRNRLEKDRIDLFYKALHLMLNVSWSKKERRCFATLGLNLLHYLLPASYKQNLKLPKVIQRLNAQKMKASYIHPSFDKNLSVFHKEILFPYLQWYQQYKDNQSKKRLVKRFSNINNTSLIFSKKIGFNVLVRKKTTHHGSNTLIDICREAYPAEDAHTIKKFTAGQQALYIDIKPFELW